MLSGLDHQNANALGDGGGDHARAGACFLTGVHPKKTAGADIQAGISADQIAAQDSARRRGSHRSNSAARTRAPSARAIPGIAAHTRTAFPGGAADPDAAGDEPPHRLRTSVRRRGFQLPLRKRARVAPRSASSILDVVNNRTQRLVQDLGPADRRKLDEYLTGVRELEQRIQLAEKDQRHSRPDMEKPAGVPVAFADYMKMMFDLQVLAFQADVTRVSTLLFGREASVRTYGEIGVQ